MPRQHGFRHTQESKEKIRAAMQGRTFSKETLARMKAAAVERGKQYVGSGNPAWKGGTYKSRQRTMQYVAPKTYVPRARLVLEQKLGRSLGCDENAHHINGDQTDDSPTNLEAIPHNEHARHHATARIRDQRTKRWLS